MLYRRIKQNNCQSEDYYWKMYFLYMKNIHIMRNFRSSVINLEKTIFLSNVFHVKMWSHFYIRSFYAWSKFINIVILQHKCIEYRQKPLLIQSGVSFKNNKRKKGQSYPEFISGNLNAALVVVLITSSFCWNSDRDRSLWNVCSK